MSSATSDTAQNSKCDPLNDQVGGSHYKGMKIQPVEYAEANNLSATEFAILKYLSRHKLKGGAEDVKKLIHFGELLLKLQYGIELPPRMQESDVSDLSLRIDTEMYERLKSITRDGETVGDTLKIAINLLITYVLRNKAKSTCYSKNSSCSSRASKPVEKNNERPVCSYCGNPDCMAAHYGSNGSKPSQNVLEALVESLEAVILADPLNDRQMSLETAEMPEWYEHPAWPEGYKPLCAETSKTEKPHPVTKRFCYAVAFLWRRPDGTEFKTLAVTARGKSGKYYELLRAEIETVQNEFSTDFRRSNSYTPHLSHITWFDTV